MIKGTQEAEFKIKFIQTYLCTELFLPNTTINIPLVIKNIMEDYKPYPTWEKLDPFYSSFTANTLRWYSGNCHGAPQVTNTVPSDCKRRCFETWRGRRRPNCLSRLLWRSKSPHFHKAKVVSIIMKAASSQLSHYWMILSWALG